jgi:tetratricopeptide (TPR) repeat protein
LNAVIEIVPEAYRTSVDVAYALGFVARNKQDFKQAEYWFQIALDRGDQNIFDIKVTMAGLILEQISAEPSTVQTQQLGDEDRTRIETAIQLLTDAWSQIAETDLRSLHPEVLMNRGMANAMLDRLDLAIADLDIALQIAPNNLTFKKNRALLARDLGDYFRAIQILKSLVDVSQIPEAEIALAEILHETKAHDQATEVIQNFIAKNPNLPLYEQARRVLVQIYIDTSNIQAAVELYNTIQDKDSKTVADLIDAARIAYALGRAEDALQNLEQARYELEELTLSQPVLDLAHAYYMMQQYDIAAYLYEKCVNTNLNTPLNRRLIECYYHAGQFRSALTICQSLRQKYGASKFIGEIEFTIYGQINDLNEAKRVGQAHLSQYPDDLYMQLHLASVNYRLRCFQELDTFLNSSIDISQLSLEMSLHLVKLYAFREMFQKFLETLYQIRQQFFSDSRAHVAYAIEFFEYDQHPDVVGLLAHKLVEQDVAVCLEDEAGQTSWYVLVDKSVSDVHHKEISLFDSFGQKLLNKQIGEEVVLRETSFSRDSRKIAQIVSKYVYALWESLDLVNHRFPDATGLWTVKVNPAEFETGMPQSIASVVDSSRETHQFAEDLYKRNGIPLGTFAKLVQRDVLEVRSGLISNPELGIRCCRGDQEERTHAILLLSSQPVKLIVDIVTLLTLHDLNAADIVVQAFSQLGIAQSTIDLLQSEIEQNKARQTKETLTIGKDGDHFVIQEVPSELVQKYTEHLQNIQDWIEKNCDVLPCTVALDLAPGTRQELEKLIGSSFTETILIASEPGHLLYSDDWVLGQVAKAKFGIERVWTQVVLMQCQAQALIDRLDYSQMVIKLVALNHHYTSIDAATLIEAARQADWLLKLPLTPLLKFLGIDNPNRSLILNDNQERLSVASAISVFMDFLYELWKLEISYERREALVMGVLNALIRGRYNRTAIVNQLLREVRHRFYWLPFDQQRILSLINSWRYINLV